MCYTWRFKGVIKYVMSRISWRYRSCLWVFVCVIMDDGYASTWTLHWVSLDTKFKLDASNCWRGDRHPTSKDVSQNALKYVRHLFINVNMNTALTQNSNWMRQIVDVANVILRLKTFPKRVKIGDTFVYQRKKTSKFTFGMHFQNTSHCVYVNTK
jgi:hypothetical protein